MLCLFIVINTARLMNIPGEESVACFKSTGEVTSVGSGSPGQEADGINASKHACIDVDTGSRKDSENPDG